MAFLGGLFNSDMGAGFKAQSANVQNPVSTDQAQAAMAAAQQNQLGQAQGAYGQAQQGYNQQQQFVNALAGQNGIANQSSVYGQQQALADQLSQRAAGGGPNPALAQLAQTTGANTANQAALMAGQRGAGANAGLIARQAAQQGAANQQNAIGQAATLSAQQQIAAQQALGQQQQAMAGLAGQQVAQQQGALGQSNNIAQQQQQAALNMANTQIGQAQGNQNAALGAIQGQNQANVSNTSQQNSANQAIASGNQKAQAGLFNGLVGGIGSALMLNQGGMVPGYADGGQVDPNSPQSYIGKFAKGFKMPGGTDPDAMYTMGGTALGGAAANGINKLIGLFNQPDASTQGAGMAPGLGVMQGANPFALQGGLQADPMAMPAQGLMAPQMQAMPQGIGAPGLGIPTLAKGGKVPVMLSPGEGKLTKEQAKRVAEGKESPMDGERVPGKAKVKGDSKKNDTVATKANVGDVIIPRSHMQSEEKARKFVEALFAKGKSRL